MTALNIDRVETRDAEADTLDSFNRPPRVLRKLPAGEVEIPALPGMPMMSLPVRFRFILLPAITGVFYLIALTARGGQGGSIWFSLPIVLISFASVGIGIWTHISQRREQEKVRLEYDNAYAETLEKVRNHLHSLDAEQRRIDGSRPTVRSCGVCGRRQGERRRNSKGYNQRSQSRVSEWQRSLVNPHTAHQTRNRVSSNQ